MHVEFIAYLFIAAVNLAVGGYIFLKNPKSVINWSFFVITLGIVGWLMGMVFVSRHEHFFFVILTLWSAEIMVLGFVLLSEVFPDGGKKDRNFPFFLLPWTIIFILTPSRYFVSSAQLDPGGYLRPNNEVLFPLLGIVMGGYLAWSSIRFLVNYRRLRGIRRVQMRYLMAGSWIFLTAVFIADILLPTLHVFKFNHLGPLFSLVFVGCVGYAILRHRFMDIRMVIRRGLLYGVMVAAIAILFFSIDHAVFKLIHAGELSDVTAAVIGAFGFIEYKKYFEKITDRVFFRKDYDYSRAVGELGPLLNATIDLKALIDSVKTFLGRTIKPKTVVFIFPDAPLKKYTAFINEFAALPRVPIFFQEFDGKGEGLKNIAAMAANLGVAAIIPLFSKEGKAPLILLGEKLSDDIFRPKDIELLRVLSHQAGIAIKNAELYEKIRISNEELERRVFEKTEKIKNMYDAQSRFLTDVSHELQTPIAILQGNLDALEKGENRKKALRIVRTTIEGMSRLTVNLLESAHLNFSQNNFLRKRIDAERLLREVYEDCSILALNKGIIFTASTEKCFISGERRKLKEVLFNLISNALRHTKSGGTIQLSGKLEGSTVHITIKDSGSGIAPKDLKRVFDRFYKIGGGRSQGTGIGLDICRQIIEMHKGTIVAESELGKGSTFAIAFPALA